MTMQLPQQQPGNGSLIRLHLAQQKTLPYQAIKLPVTPDPVTSSVPSLTDVLEESPEQSTSSLLAITKKQSIIRIATSILIGILGVSIYFIWHPSTPSTPTPAITQFSTVSSAQKGQVTATTNGTIQVYIVGAVRHPGVYTLAGNTRLYQLLQQAGGTLSNANMAQLNLAERLIDGQEVYIAAIDETPPVSAHSSTGITTARSSVATAPTTGATGSLAPGQLININTASSEELRQGLHISSKTAEAIITYRVQQGSFTSVEQLLQVVSKTIYNKIKGQVTVA